MNNFDLKKFLTENRLTSVTRALNEEGLGFERYLDKSTNTIDLGTTNGWGKDKYDLYKQLEASATGKVTSESLNFAGTYKEYSLPVNIDGKDYKVVWRTDSSG